MKRYCFLFYVYDVDGGVDPVIKVSGSKDDMVFLEKAAKDLGDG